MENTQILLSLEKFRKNKIVILYVSKDGVFTKFFRKNGENFVKPPSLLTNYNDKKTSVKILIFSEFIIKEVIKDRQKCWNKKIHV